MTRAGRPIGAVESRLADLPAGRGALTAGLEDPRGAFEAPPAFATPDRFTFAVFGLAARRPAGTGFRFGAVFAFRI
jgi:hypothetical protein